jgi:LAO/AO transport system kinase
MLDELWQRFAARDRLALSRLASMAARGELEQRTIDEHAVTQTKASRVVAVTGPGGVGKSTFVGKLLAEIRRRGESVAVLACDPESTITGGALLGDRVRMPFDPHDDGVWIRSLATQSGRQGLAEHLDVIVRLARAFGFDNVLIETVGAGQGDVAVRDIADVVVVLVQPATGDDLQWEKAGQLEIADVVVIHKADLPGSQQTEAELRDFLNLPGYREVPIVRASAKSGTGVAEAWETVVERSSNGDVRKNSMS